VTLSLAAWLAEGMLESTVRTAQCAVYPQFDACNDVIGS
jgi:hypothetical protein